MCKKCENLEQLAHKIQKAVKKLALKPDESLKDHLIDFLRDNADFWHNQSEWWRERSDFWRDEHPESTGNNFDGDRLHNAAVNASKVICSGFSGLLLEVIGHPLYSCPVT